ncbi:MAG: hypothetical protein FD174_2614 [Geobacteraceae bacterium]|nr:MAG: hypothetical protein FD174_2614 [Geobacteraceae bacterium]
MGQLVSINGREMQRMELQGLPVVTLRQVDEMHGRPGGTTRRNFNQNKKHFIEGEDYFVRNSFEAKQLCGTAAPNGLTLLTESGYLMIAKSFTDELSWKVQRELVNCYFRGKPTVAPVLPDAPVSIPKDRYIELLEAENRILRGQTSTTDPTVSSPRPAKPLPYQKRKDNTGISRELYNRYTKLHGGRPIYKWIWEDQIPLTNETVCNVLMRNGAASAQTIGVLAKALHFSKHEISTMLLKCRGGKTTAQLVAE